MKKEKAVGFLRNTPKNPLNKRLGEGRILSNLTPIPYDDILPSLMSKERERLTLEGARFTSEDKSNLEKAGFEIDMLTKQSINTLRDVRRPLWSTWHNRYPQFEALTSRMSEVAINPRTLFLPESNGKTLREQEVMVQAYARHLKQTVNVNGVDIVIGEMPDYIDLAFAYLDRTGTCLFGKDYGYNYARTKTKVNESLVARVGHFHAARGLRVHYWPHNSGFGMIFAAPLIFPKAA